MNSLCSFLYYLFYQAAPFWGQIKILKKLVADGLTPKELYQQAEDKVESGLIEQAIDQYENLRLISKFKICSPGKNRYCL